MNNNYTVYMHKNKINGKKYVGITCTTLRKRWRKGRGYYPKENGKSRFWNAIQKYGWDNFEHGVIAMHLTLEQAGEMEKMLIREWGLLDHSKGYNIAEGGSNGNNFAGKTEEEMKEIRQKISENLKGENHPMFGKHHTDEARKKISENKKGKTLSEEHRRKLSENSKGEKNPNYGKHHTEETRKKISESQKGKHHTDEARKKMSESRKGEHNPMYGKTGTENPTSKAVIAFTDSGSYYKEFAGMHDAERELGVRSSHICRCIKGGRKSAGKYKGEKIRWKYKE